ncbi:RNA 2',3'-cyclic phosphodiesterase [Marinivivus vitaminiproducens]|uniref:RNA 2',3'-cyclic phosphodiesterase n=1 Tax=Marinivivus vitaminiproducens TaxID=3035935 RepID=UPI00279BF885|nr:RNA 2',3'-cyclic phosphodiesterase [Geminicoccaceae bacterium SCSIO 64248]
MRLFVALDLPEPIQAELDRLETPMAGVRWLEDDQRHVTLRFIGEVDPGRLGDIADRLAEAAGEPFQMGLKGLGHFPPRGQPQTLWVGVDAPPALQRLKAAIDRSLREADLPPDGRRFVPHVTIARLRHAPPADRFGDFLMRHNLFRSEPFVVQGFSLYSSHLRPEGALYVEEARYDFMAVDVDDL